MKYKILLSITIFILSTAIIGLLYWFTAINRNHKNGFKRKFSSAAISLINRKSMSPGSYYIAGLARNHLYFGKENYPLSVMETDPKISKISSIAIGNKLNTQFIAPFLTIDSPTFYISDQVTSSIVSGNTDGWQIKESIPDTVPQDLITPISNRSFAIRVYDRNEKQYVLAKKTICPVRISQFPSILEPQSDRLFSTDGMLDYDAKSKSLVFVYYYRNQFISMDSNLQVLHRSRTVDTTSTFKTKVARTGLGGALTLTGPPEIVNRKSYASNGYLFVNSNLEADNEREEIFLKSSVIDVYDIKNGNYMLSFYLPVSRRDKISDFRVDHNIVAVISGNSISTYRIDSTFLFRIPDDHNLH